MEKTGMKVGWIIMSLLILPELHSQTLIEKAGGIRTDFIITSNGAKLSISEQAILKRGNVGFDYSFTNGYGYGYGLQTFHLEFITTGIIEGINKRQYYEIKFKGPDNSLLLITKLYRNDIKGLSNGSGLYVYSMDLLNIPMIILDKTKIIQIEIKKD